MSKSEQTALEKAQGEQERASVFDFLYHDSRRIGSFLAQLDQNGLLTGIRHTDQVAKTGKRGINVQLGASSPLLGGGNVGFERSPSEAGSESLERIYDPFWANALEFLDAIEARGMLNRDIERGRIGQFVLVTGVLAIADLSLLAPLWSQPLVKKHMLAGAKAAEDAANAASGETRQQRRSKQRASGQSQAISDNEVGLEMLRHMPHSGQMSVVTADYAVWSLASADSLVTTMPDLILKHGSKVAGEWSMVGILDALPDDETSGLSTMDMLHLGMFGSGGLSTVAHQMNPFVRDALGRPMFCYGVTPLLVFREIGM